MFVLLNLIAGDGSEYVIQRPPALLCRSLVHRGGDVFSLCTEALLPKLLLGCVRGVNLPPVISLERRYW